MHIFRDKYQDRDGAETDEILTDTYRMETIHNGEVYKVQGKLKTESMKFDEASIGANASADGVDADAGGEDAVVSGVDVILALRLQPYALAKKDYMAYQKDYMKTVKKIMEKDEMRPADEVQSFVTAAQEFVMAVRGEFKEYDFYVGESMAPGSMLVHVRWDGEVPYVYYFKEGLLAQKV